MNTQISYVSGQSLITFPKLRIYKFWDKPVGELKEISHLFEILTVSASGPHPVAMFEVNVFTLLQTGVFFSWLVVNRGPCS